MTRSLLRATTALTLSLSLLQPGALTAQSLGEALERLERPEQLDPAQVAEWQALCAGEPETEGCSDLRERLDEWQALCAAEPEAEGCAELGAILAAEDATHAQVEAEAEGEAEAEVQAEVEAEAEHEVVSDPEADEAAPEAELAPEDVAQEPTSERADESVEAPSEEIVEEPSEEVAEESVPVESNEAAEADAEAGAEAGAEGGSEIPAEDTAEDAVDAPADTPEETVTEEAAEAPMEAPAEDVAEEGMETPAEVAVEDEPVVEDAAPEAADEAEPATATDAEAGAEAEAEVAADAPEPVTEDDLEASETLLSDPEVAEAAETLSQALSATETDEATGDDAPLAGAAAALAAMLREGEAAEDEPVAEGEAAEVVETELTEDTTRSSAEEFASGLTAEVDTARPRDSGMSDLERAGLAALGALAVGVILSNGNRVVASSGDRVVVDRGDGDLALWKDDDALLRQPGANQRVERFADGSTITRLDRADGTQIITIRDATGRVLRRARVEVDGSQTLLIDDTQRVQPVEVSQLPPPRMAEVQITEGSDPELVRALLLAAEQPEIGRSFSLRQVREVNEVRELAPEFSGTRILFETGSSAVRPDEASKLLQLGRLMQDMIAENPREVFLIEGHTDAVGSAAFNLALSDRRAESVALALSEYFGVPAENMVVQGYGEEYLKILTGEAEPENRRVAVRRITWLLAQR